MKVLVGALNKEKDLVGAFSVIVKADGSFAALLESVGGLQAVQWRAAAGGRPHNSIRIINVTRRGGRAQTTTAKNKQK